MATTSRVEYLKTILKFTKRAMDEGWDYLLQEQYERIKEELQSLTGKGKAKPKN